MYKLFLLLLLPFAQALGQAQPIGEWKAYTSFRTINAAVMDNDGRIWTASKGGVALFEDQQIVITFTTVEGLSRLDGTAIGYDPTRNRILVGYVTGELDVIQIDDMSVQNISDISRNENFSSKAINDLLVNGDDLFVATDFGIVWYDLTRLLVVDTFTELGSFSPGNSVYDFFVDGNTLYAATQSGIAYTSLDGRYEPPDWSNFDGSNGFVNESVNTTGVFEGLLYAATNSENYIYDGSSWSVTNEFSNNEVLDFKRYNNNTFVALTSRVVYRKGTGSSFGAVPLPTTFAISVAEQNDTSEGIYIGTLNLGLGILTAEDTEMSFATPSGPYQNSFDGLLFDDGVLISGSTHRSSGNFNIDYGKGYHIFDGEVWKNFNGQNNQTLNDAIYYLVVSTTATEEYYYFGSWGQGVSRHSKATDEILVFNESNSSLRGWVADDPDFPVINGLDTDSKGDVWIVSRFGTPPLYRQTPGDTDWQAFSSNSAVSGNDLYESLFIDSFDQKWIPLQAASTAGTGLLVLDTGKETDPEDDRGVKLTTADSNGNLPDNKVKAIIQDKNGEIWVGTERGIARFLFPERIVDGSSAERRAQWLINEDTTAVSRFLLRDLNVSAMAVNAANEKWIGSENQGVWLLNAEGSRIEKRFTAENSPLFSNTIKSIAVNDETGEVFIATDLGLISYTDVPRKGSVTMDELKVYPNPFSYERHSSIVIEGLGNETTVRILGVDGTVINSIEARGGRITWNGKDYRNQKVGTGVYFVVAIGSDGSGKGMGKVIIVR